MTTITLEGKEYQLDIEQAEKLGLLKEKYGRVKSWEEFKEKYHNECGYFYEAHKNRAVKTSSPISMCNQLTPHESQALTAFTKLLKLRRDWIGEWEPKNEVYAIVYWKSMMIDWIDCEEECRSLSFPTEQMAEEFLETFCDLIEEAKILI
jgi:hypothetical protein